MPLFKHLGDGYLYASIARKSGRAGVAPAASNASKMILIIIVITLLANLADLLLKLGANESAGTLDDPLSIFLSPWVWLGAVLGIGAMVTWVYVLGRHHISHAYPVFVGLGFLNITLIAWLYFKEEISLQRLAGTLLILAGIIAVHLQSGETAAPDGSEPVTAMSEPAAGD